MELLEALRTRRTIKEFDGREVPETLILQSLEAGLWAQNHRLTQPWRFHLVGAQTKTQIAQIFPKILQKPVVVAVSCLKSDGGEQEWEDQLAVACAIQNIHLRAHDLGLGMQWSSGKAAIGPRTSEILGLETSREILMALLFFGFARETPPARERLPLAQVLRRLD